MLWDVIYEKNGDRRISPPFRTQEEAEKHAEWLRSQGFTARVTYFFPAVNGD